MQIVRLQPGIDKNTIASALRDSHPSRGAADRFALVTATIGEHEKRSFLVAAKSTDKDAGLLKNASVDKLITLSSRDAAGEHVVTAKVDSYVELGDAQYFAMRNAARMLGALGAGMVGAIVAIQCGLGGVSLIADSPGWFGGVMGALATWGGFSAFARFAGGHEDRDWAGALVKSHFDGAYTPVEVKSVEQAPKIAGALPPPTQSPFVVGQVLLPEKVAV